MVSHIPTLPILSCLFLILQVFGKQVNDFGDLESAWVQRSAVIALAHMNQKAHKLLESQDTLHKSVNALRVLAVSSWKEAASMTAQWGIPLMGIFDGGVLDGEYLSIVA